MEDYVYSRLVDASRRPLAINGENYKHSVVWRHRDGIRPCLARCAWLGKLKAANASECSVAAGGNVRYHIYGQQAEGKGEEGKRER